MRAWPQRVALRDGVAVAVADGEIVTAGGPRGVALEVTADGVMPLRIRTVALLRR